MIARTARIAFHRAGPLIAAGAAAFDKRGLCVACIVTWRRHGEKPGYARISHFQIEESEDLVRFVQAASQGLFRSNPALAADYDRIETLFQRGPRSPASFAARTVLFFHSCRINLRLWRERHAS